VVRNAVFGSNRAFAAARYGVFRSQRPVTIARSKGGTFARAARRGRPSRRILRAGARPGLRPTADHDDPADDPADNRSDDPADNRSDDPADNRSDDASDDLAAAAPATTAAAATATTAAASDDDNDGLDARRNHYGARSRDPASPSWPAGRGHRVERRDRSRLIRVLA
jgi:hypothetical protein